MITYQLILLLSLEFDKFSNIVNVNNLYDKEHNLTGLNLMYSGGIFVVIDESICLSDGRLLICMSLNHHIYLV